MELSFHAGLALPGWVLSEDFLSFFSASLRSKARRSELRKVTDEEVEERERPTKTLK
jgi:hypothetical protein